MAWWRLKSPASHLFTQPFIQAQIKENIKAPPHWPLWEKFTGDRWIPILCQMPASIFGPQWVKFSKYLQLVCVWVETIATTTTRAQRKNPILLLSLWRLVSSGRPKTEGYLARSFRPATPQGHRTSLPPRFHQIPSSKPKHAYEEPASCSRLRDWSNRTYYLHLWHEDEFVWNSFPHYWSCVR